MKTLNKIFKIVLALVLALCTLGSILLCALNTTALKDGFINEGILNSEFENELATAVEIDIARISTSRVPSWIPELFAESVSNGDLTDYAVSYYGGIHSHIIKGGKFETPKFESEKLRNAILAYLESQPQNEASDETDISATAEQNYMFVCDTVQSTVAIVGNNILDKIPSLYSILSKLDIIAYIVLALALISAAAILIMDRKRLARALYFTMTVGFISSALIFIPSFMFRSYGFANKLVVNIPFFKVLIHNIINEILGAFMTVSGVLLAIVLVVLIISIILILRRSAKEDRQSVQTNNEEKTTLY